MQNMSGAFVKLSEKGTDLDPNTGKSSDPISKQEADDAISSISGNYLNDKPELKAMTVDFLKL